ncbi:MAG TPA: hypothetical protein VFN26_17435 [Candidatus Acidoferrum sp.]|nr:hypothetical protein [Candidatus Acidoferrum sp.]
MLTKKGVIIVSLALLSALFMVATIPWSSAQTGSYNGLGENPIVGSWHVTVSFDDGRPDVLALYTFDRDRTFVMGGSWPGVFGPGHGAWNQDQDTSVSINLTFFRLLYTPTESNEATGSLNGAFNGTLKVQAKLTVSDDGQSFSGRYLLTNFDPSGNVRSTATGNLNGTLVVVEPLP